MFKMCLGKKIEKQILKTHSGLNFLDFLSIYIFMYNI